MEGDGRPEWRKRTDATLREIEALQQSMTEQVARMQRRDKDISAMSLPELQARVADMEIQFSAMARDLGRIRKRLGELGQGGEPEPPRENPE